MKRATTRRAVLAGALLAAAGVQAQAANPPAEVVAALPGAKVQGSGTLRFFGLRVYDARLWAGAAAVAEDWSAAPFALDVTYARSLKGEQIAERSLTEMKRQGDIAADVAARWLAQLKELIPDVAQGDRITGVHTPGAAARLFFNGQLRGELQGADFARMFFGIWLSPRTAEPALRSALLGRAAP